MKPPPGPGAPAPFTEKVFYLREFRGRCLAFAIPPGELAPGPLLRTLDELRANEIRILGISSDAGRLERALGGPVLAMPRPAGAEAAPRPEQVARLAGPLWRALAARGCAAVSVDPQQPLAPACRALAARLGVGKLVLIDPEGGLRGREGQRLSFVHLAELRAMRAGDLAGREDRQPLLREVQAMLEAGVPAVNVCSAGGVADELFSYAGSGTLFTPDRYVHVRALVLDDFDAANDLLARGMEEGFLAQRTPEQVDELLAGGIGAFVEGVHLAGIASLLVEGPRRPGEIAGLYTLTRFVGEGIGGHLVAFALERAAALGLPYVFACTTSARVGAFFERQGFRRVAPGEVPAEKWRGYDRGRRARVRCYRRDLGA